MTIHENQDLRVRRTRKLLQEALIDLTVEKGFAAVSIRDICERAMVNRSTFYRHYLDKYALLNEYIDALQAAISEAYRGHNPEQTGVPPALMKMLEHIQASPDFYRVMLGAQGDARFIQRFRDVIEGHLRVLTSDLAVDPNVPPLDLRLSYVSCADIGAILWWLENGQQASLEELAVWIGQLGKASMGIVAPKG
jgi:AcrR family transcriptional regulator